MEKLLERWFRKEIPEIELSVEKIPGGRWKTRVPIGSSAFDCCGRSRRESVETMLGFLLGVDPNGKVSSPEELELLLESEGR